jgi:preprotein translocase subunit YajC
VSAARSGWFLGRGFPYLSAPAATAFGEEEKMNSMLRMIPAVSLLLAQPSQPNGFALFLPLILIMVIFYFLMIMPAQRRQKKVAAMLKELKNGDKVITTGGLYGTIVGLEGDTVQLRIADQVRIKISRSAVAGLQPEQKES